MVLEITITPVGDQWSLSAPELGEDLHFSGGGQAETAGRNLARRLAAAGQAATLTIVLRDGQVAARLPYPAALAA